MSHLALTDKYTNATGQIFLSGIQALVRLPMVQIRRDRAAGLHTAGFISGYRGSPLGGYDQQLLAAKPHLDALDIVVRPAVNEDLAATAVWGTQQLHLSPGHKFDGVAAIWYGKGPGVDRSGDVFKHGNAAGSASHGGVLCIAGDDHGATSSSIPHQSDHAFISALMPILYPSSIHEFVELGLLGFSMSRYSGCWVAMKVLSSTVDTQAAIDLNHETTQFCLPTDFELPQGGLNLRCPDDRWRQDDRLQTYKGYAAIAFARANRIDRVVLDAPSARLGIVASGKAYEDVRQALRELGITPTAAQTLGVRFYKVRMPWPLEPEGIRQFALGLEEMLIVEERREIIEHQVKQQLFNWRADVRPRIVGKFDDQRLPVLSLSAELSTETVAILIADRLLRLSLPEDWRARLTSAAQRFKARVTERAQYIPAVSRPPFYCPGCPHNTSTKVPDGSRALAGIGCHFMAQWMDRNTETFTQMGGEGVSWVGIASFTDEKHIFANLGDGTYFHSGILAIRQAVAAGVNITYKLLYNDAVAMTGGQAVDGYLSPELLTRQLADEGVKIIYLLAETPEAYPAHILAPGVIVQSRDTIDEVMKTLRATPGCTAIVYVQTCAAEKRRRRRRGEMVEPDVRVFINPDVCEGCGDCSTQSNCIAVEPLETAFGRKRQINQSSCNKDFSCLKGFCPSFVTVHGAKMRRAPAIAAPATDSLPTPTAPAIAPGYNIGLAGVGGTGILTASAVLGMAAHLEGKRSIVLEMSGLAQKGGAVLSHVRMGTTEDDVGSPHIVSGGADLILIADPVVGASPQAIQICGPIRTTAVINRHLTPVAQFVRHRDFDMQPERLLAVIRKETRSIDRSFDFDDYATRIFGERMPANIMMLGFAFQRGLLPLTTDSIEQAITLNGIAIPQNLAAFRWGRWIAHDRRAVDLQVSPSFQAPLKLTLKNLIAHRAAHLTRYQDASLAHRYLALVEQVRARTKSLSQGEDLVRTVAANYAKLLAYKDEYEVARLHLERAFQAALNREFEGKYALSYYLAPPLLARTGPDGRPKKIRFGSWITPLFRLLCGMRRLRGTPLDVFGYTAERRKEKALIYSYEALVAHVLAGVRPDNAAIAHDLLALPDQIRGFGPVKMAAVAAVEIKWKTLLTTFDQAAPTEVCLPSKNALLPHGNHLSR